MRGNINNGEWDFDELRVNEIWQNTDFDFIGLEFPDEKEEAKPNKKGTADDESEEESDDEEDLKKLKEFLRTLKTVEKVQVQR